METTGERIVFLRRKLGLDQQILADALGVTKQQISRYEKGISTINVEDIKIIADVLKTSVQYLITGEATPRVEEPQSGYRVLKNEEYIELLKQANANLQSENTRLKNNQTILSNA